MAEHVPAQVGAYDRNGRRTFQTAGDVCLGCSEPDNGVWIPVNMCPRALVNFEAEEAWLRGEGPQPPRLELTGVATEPAKTPRVIGEFTGEYRFLSNFYEWPLLLPDGRVAPSLEHGYQAYKAAREEDYLAVLAADTPGDAKRLGRRVALTPGWDAHKLNVMRRLLRLKFPFLVTGDGRCWLSEALLGTGDALLVEGNTWHDTFWGVCSCGRCARESVAQPGEVGGLNWLGHLLTARRAELRGGPE